MWDCNMEVFTWDELAGLGELRSRCLGNLGAGWLAWGSQAPEAGGTDGQGNIGDVALVIALSDLK